MIKGRIKKLLFLAFPILIVFGIMELISQILLIGFYSDWNQRIHHYITYHDKVNHLRHLNFDLRLPSEYRTPDSQIYSRLTPTDTSWNSEVLVQGDSWAESFVSYTSSRNMIERAGIKQNRSYVISGTSSYSPSLMSAQINFLHKDFGISPIKVVAVIDQTDIGDELCRYKDYRYEENGEYWVRSFGYERDNETYFVKPMLFKTQILESHNFSLVKMVRLAINNFYIPKKPGVCGWNDIQKYLLNDLSKEETAYFLEVMSDYIRTVFRIDSVETLIIVSFPHKKNLSSEYRNHLDELIEISVNRSGRRQQIEILNSDFFVTKIAQSNLSLDDIYISEDPSSHLTEISHTEILTKSLIEHLDVVD